MSYVLPNGGAANFNFAGEAYSTPSGSAANFGWGTFSGWPLGTVISGAGAGTRFGTPRAAQPYLIHSSAASTIFGFPRRDGYYAASYIASGSVFGSPSARYAQTTEISGYARTTVFGTPTGTQVWYVGRTDTTTRFGTPILKRNVSCEPTGFSTTKFGEPLALYGVVTTGRRVCYVLPVLSSTAFGRPACNKYLRTDVLGWDVSSVIGGPKAQTAHSAFSLAQTTFGVPQAQIRTHPIYVGATQFGVPGMRVRVYPSHIASTVFGRPASILQLAASPVAWVSTTLLGAPTQYARHAIHPSSSTTKFGTPTMSRNQMC